MRHISWPDDAFVISKAQGVFAVLTSERLIMVRTRIGALGVLLENGGVEGRFVHVKRGARGLSNQIAFLRDVPRILAPQGSVVPSGASPSFGAPARTW